MRILHLDSGREMRGGQWQALHLMAGLAAMGHEQLLLARTASSLAREAASRGIPTGPLDVFSLAARARRFDLLHAHDARSHALAAPFARGRLIVARRVAFPLKRTPASRWKYARAAHIAAVSEFVRGVLLEAGLSANRVSVVYDGVSLPREPASLATSRVVAINSADPLKGRTLIEKAAALAGITVCFSPDLAADLPSASLFVYITESEGLGSAALLASAHGIPVVASRVGGLSEAVEDGITGLLTPNDPAAVASAITTILNSPSLARQMGAAGRSRVARRFTIEAMVRGTLAVYEKVPACPRP